MYSDIAIKVLAARDLDLFQTNAQFWSQYSDVSRFIELCNSNVQINLMVEKLVCELDSADNPVSIVCAFDGNFPQINQQVKNKGDKPFLLFFRGDLSLLGNLNNNVAVIGLTDPNDEITNRENAIVKTLVDNNLVIVSGLALGCDTNAHKSCLENNGKTIAILPSPLTDIYPAINRNMAEQIVEQNGLLISEYYRGATTKYEAINRFIERDRLQAMFSKAIILIASYRKNEGDSGSRHAMEAAKKYRIARYAMFNNQIDWNNQKFGLNKDLIEARDDGEVKILTPSMIDEIKSLINPNLVRGNSVINEQLRLI